MQIQQTWTAENNYFSFPFESWLFGTVIIKHINILGSTSATQIKSQFSSQDDKLHGYAWINTHRAIKNRILATKVECRCNPIAVTHCINLQ